MFWLIVASVPIGLFLVIFLITFITAKALGVPMRTAKDLVLCCRCRDYGYCMPKQKIKKVPIDENHSLEDVTAQALRNMTTAKVEAPKRAPKIP